MYFLVFDIVMPLFDKFPGAPMYTYRIIKIFILHQYSHIQIYNRKKHIVKNKKIILCLCNAGHRISQVKKNSRWF